jgi:hypothetical protein
MVLRGTLSKPGGKMTEEKQREWIEYNGNNPPDKGASVQWKVRDIWGSIETYPKEEKSRKASNISWERDDSGYDIIAYRIIPECKEEKKS